MVPLLTQAAAGTGAAFISYTHKCSIEFANPKQTIFTKRRTNISTPRRVKSLTVANAGESPGGATTSGTSSRVTVKDESSISFVEQENVPLEGVIQFEKPDFSARIKKWGLVGVLAGGDVSALLLFSAIGRFSHGLSVLDFETFKTADPFIAGWFLSAYFLGGYGEEGRGKKGLSKAVIAAAKSWAVGIPLGVLIRATAIGHIPPTNFILVTLGSTAVLLIGWRAILFSIFFSDKGKKNDVYKRGNPFELFGLLTSLVRRW